MTPENKLKALLEKEDYGAGARLAEYLGVPRNYISRWAKGVSRYKIPKELLPKIAKFFGVPLDYFFEDTDKISVKLIPFIGKASCGVPMEYVYDASEYLPVPSNLGDHLYAIEAEGDSMSPKIKSGDLVLCDMDKEVKDSDIVHYTVDGDSGIKKIKFTGSGIMLIPLNPNYEPIFYSDDQLKHLTNKFVKCVRVIASL